MNPYEEQELNDLAEFQREEAEAEARRVSPVVTFVFENNPWEVAPHAPSYWAAASSGTSETLNKIVSKFVEYAADVYEAKRVEILDIGANPTENEWGHQFFACIRYDGYYIAELAMNSKYKVESYLD